MPARLQRARGHAESHFGHRQTEEGPGTHLLPVQRVRQTNGDHERHGRARRTRFHRCVILIQAAAGRNKKTTTSGSAPTPLDGRFLGPFWAPVGALLTEKPAKCLHFRADRGIMPVKSRRSQRKLTRKLPCRQHPDRLKRAITHWSTEKRAPPILFEQTRWSFSSRGPREGQNGGKISRNGPHRQLREPG